MVAGLQSIAKAMESPPEPTVRAPALDPTCERLRAKFPGSTHPRSPLTEANSPIPMDGLNYVWAGFISTVRHVDQQLRSLEGSNERKSTDLWYFGSRRRISCQTSVGSRL